MPRPFLPALLVLAAAPAAFPDDDLEFARALAHGGYLDLAEEVCATAPVGAGSAVELVRDEIRVAQARQLADRWRTEPSPEIRAALQREASALFDSLIRSARERIANLQGQARNADDLLDARLHLPRIEIERARLEPPDSPEKKRLLTEAIGLLDEFQFDYGDRPAAYEAMRLTGECWSDLGNLDRAASNFAEAASILDRLHEADIPPDPDHRAIHRAAVYSAAQIEIRRGRPAEAIRWIDRAFEEDRTLKGTPAGFALDLFKARILHDHDRPEEAMAIARRVVTDDADGPWAADAKDLIQVWVAGAAASSRATAEQLMTAGESLFERGRWRESLQALRACIEASTSPTEREKFVPAAFYKMGQAHLYLKPARNYEAAWAFSQVCAYVPNPLAPRACFQAVSCFNREYVLSGDARDEQLRNQYLKMMQERWPNDSSAGDRHFQTGCQWESDRRWHAAALEYLRTAPQSENFEPALVRAGYCLYTDAIERWKDSRKDAAARATITPGMTQAEDAFLRFLSRIHDPACAPADEERKQSRASLAFIARQQLALLYLHESVGRAEAALPLLDDAARDLAPQDPRLAKLWGFKVRAYLSLDRLDAAVDVLDQMLDRCRDGEPVAVAAKSVAVRLHEATLRMIDAHADEAAIASNLKKISVYYDKWLNEAPAAGLRVTLTDVESVADTLYDAARRLNGLDERVASFLDLRGRAVADRDAFQRAALVYGILAEGRIKLSAPHPDWQTRLARSLSFGATSPDEWARAKEAYQSLLRTCRLTDADENLIPDVLQQNPALLSPYLELCGVYVELGRCGAKYQFDNAVVLAGNVQQVSQPGSEPWWIAKYLQILSLYLRGVGSDLDMAGIAIDNLERNHPDFDGDRFGLKTKFLALRKK